MESVRDSEFEKFRRTINKYFSPNVYVCATQKAKETCHKNLVTPAEFLRPFGYFQETTIRYRSADNKERLLSLSNFHLNFVDAEEFEQPKKEHIENHIKEVINTYAPEKLNEEMFSVNRPEQLLSELSSLSMPWYDHVVDAIFNFTKFQFDLNFLDHPFSLFYMISTKETDAKQAAKQLINEHSSKITRIFNSNPLDQTHVPKVIIILFEFNLEEANKLEEAQKMVSQLQAEFSNYTVKLVVCNTTEDDMAYLAWDGHIYHKYYYPTNQIDLVNNKETARGRMVPRNDREFLKNVLYEIFIKQILPYLENKIRQLDSVARTKKSLGASIKRLFGGSSKTESSNNYVMNQDEVYLRSLADTLFLLEDYDGAYSNYKTLAAEIKGKSNRLYSNVIEMQNLCTMMMGDFSRKDNSFKKCFETYLENWDAIKFSIRSVIFHTYHCLLYNMREETGLLLDTAKRFKDYFPILNSIFYEQFALSFLKIAPVWPRKYAFSMVLAGHTYNQNNHRKYGQRCYQLASLMYKNTEWNMIQEHVNKTLGSNAFAGGEPLVSLSYFRKALENMKQNDTAERHSSLIKESLSAIAYVQSKKISNELTTEEITHYYEEIIKFPFPKIADEAFDITLTDDYFNFMNDRKTNKVFAEGISTREILLNRDSDQLWYNMGKRLESYIKSDSHTKRLDIEDEVSLKIMDCIYVSDKNLLLKDNPRESYIGEDILINVRVDNPYKMPLEIKDFRLEYELVPLDSTEDAPVEVLESKRENFILGELEQKYIEIRISPDKEGLLKAKGVRWTLDCIEGKHFFNLKPPAINNQKRRKHHINEIKIVKKQPKPILTLKGLKTQLFFGEVNNLILNIENKAEVDIEKIFIISSYPEMMGSEATSLGLVQAGSAVDFPLILRGSMTGIFEIRLLLKIFYKSGKPRYARIVFPLEVQSSFIPKYFTTPCFDKRIVGLQCDEIWNHPFQRMVANLDKSKCGLHIEQIVLLSNEWKSSETPNHHASYRKRENFLHFYVEPSGKDKKDTKVDSAELGKNWFKFSDDKELPLDFKTLYDYYELTFQQFCKFHHIDTSTYENNETLSLALFWRYKLENDSFQGIHFLYKIPLNYKFYNNPIAQKRPLVELPLQTQIVSPKKIKHNFSTQPACYVDIELRLINITGTSDISFKLEALNTETALSPTEVTGGKYFVWEGITEQDVNDLKPFELRTIPFRAIFFEKGVYDISRFKFSFYFNKKTRELTKGLSYKEIINSGMYETVTFSSEKDQCLIEII